MGAVAVLRLCARRDEGVRRGVGAVADRAARLPLRPRRPAARRARHAARARRLRPRRQVRRRLAREGRRRAAPWDDARYARAAYLLGRLSGSPRVAELATGRSAPLHDGRLRLRPARRPRWSRSSTTTGSGSTRWSRRPSPTSCATGCGPRRTELPAYLEEVMSLPHLTAHGDACPNNLLAAADPDGLHAHRLRLLAAHARRRRPEPAAHRRRPDRQGRAPATSPPATTPTWRRTSGASATRAATSPSPSSAAPTPSTC